MAFASDLGRARERAAFARLADLPGAMRAFRKEGPVLIGVGRVFEGRLRAFSGREDVPAAPVDLREALVAGAFA